MEQAGSCWTGGGGSVADDALELAERVNLRMQSSRHICTERVHRTWLDMLFWKCAYQTRVFDAHREALGAWPDR